MTFPLRWLRKKIGVAPTSAFQARHDLFVMLEAIFPVEFVLLGDRAPEIDAALVLNEIAGLGPQLTVPPVPVFVVEDSKAHEPFPPRSTRFAGRPGGQPWLQGWTVKWRKSVPHSRVDVAEGDEVIALADEQPVWVQRRQVSGHKLVRAGPLPELDPAVPFVLQLIDGSFATWLPLLDFLREISAAFDYDPAQMRACFMFDDPNLHWTSWGHLDYAELVQAAQRCDYHAAIATVPIDTWYTQPAAAALFRDYPNRISLLMHGVNHTHAELLRPVPDNVRARDLARGLALMARLESRHRLRVCRVMAPPHHACSPQACFSMLHLGYEAACVSWTSLLKWNHGERWGSGFGLAMTEFIAGFPVIPRISFADQDDARILLAALLHQPLVLVGHHTDVAGGLEVLAETASKIRGVGPIQWCDMTEIARGSFRTKRIGNVLWIRMHTRLAHVRVPEGVAEIFVDRPWLAEEVTEPVFFTWGETAKQTEEVGGRVIGPVRCDGSFSLTVASRPSARLGIAEARQVHLPTLWPYARRLLCECRDRLGSLLRR